MTTRQGCKKKTLVPIWYISINVRRIQRENKMNKWLMFVILIAFSVGCEKHKIVQHNNITWVCVPDEDKAHNVCPDKNKHCHEDEEPGPTPVLEEDDQCVKVVQ